MRRNKILIVDDEPGIRFGISDYLERAGFEVEEADSCRAAQESFRRSRPDAVIIDYMLPDGTALDLMPDLKEIDAHVSCVVLTGNASVDLAVRAIKEGAEQFLTKPVELAALRVILERILENQRNRQKSLARKQAGVRASPNPFLGTSTAIKHLAEQAKRVLVTDSPVLILGETGTGKGVLAAWIHGNCQRADEAVVDLNCAGLSRELLETELFGHEKGAFTGATSSKMGLFEVAHRRTMFLDEIGDMDLVIQPKLLKVLEEKKFRRLGDVRDRLVDVRLIAATSLDLAELVREKRFRSDLYFRISTIPLFVPPLRERPEDIPVLAEHLLHALAPDVGGRGNVRLAADAERALQNYTWTGNIRELKNVLERAVLLSEENLLTVKHLFFDNVTKTTNGFFEDTSLTLRQLECRYMERVLKEERGGVERAAQRLGIPRSTLYQKIKEYGIAVSKH